MRASRQSRGHSEPPEAHQERPGPIRRLQECPDTYFCFKKTERRNGELSEPLESSLRRPPPIRRGFFKDTLTPISGSFMLDTLPASLYARRINDDPSLKKGTEVMHERPHWLHYRAKDGIFETFFGPRSSPDELAHYLERAITWSQDAEVGTYQLLDSFLSDSLNQTLLSNIFSLTSATRRAKILIADPSSDFALARAKSIGQIAAKEVRSGIHNILAAIKIAARIELPNLESLSFDDLVNLVHEHESKVYLEVRFYSEAPSSPMYFFKDILVSGRFCAGLSSSKLPWTMIVDDPSVPGDLYDIYNDEFERIWEKAKTSLEHRSDPTETDNKKKPTFDLGIVTATETEWRALRRLPTVQWEKLEEISGGGSLFYSALFKKGGRQLSVIATQQTQPGMVCAAIATTKLLQLSRINFLASVGICAAVPKRATLGSIIIANQIFDAQAGKMIDGEFQSNVDSLSMDISLLRIIKDCGEKYAREAHEAFANLPHPRLTSDGPKPVVGKVATVSQVIADSDFAQQIWSQSRHCVAIEMESYAVFRAAAEEKSERRPRTIFIKAAADYADARKGDRYQSYCASISAHFLHSFALEHLAR
jgi:nucleoside phosphorylase